MKASNIAPELLCEIAKYLLKYDCYNAMYVSRHWNNCLKYEFYKKVDIKSTSQFDAFLHTLDRSQTGDEKRKEYTDMGYMVKELRLTSYGMDYPIIALTQDRLNTLSDLCPRLEVLEFDSSQWANMSNMVVFKNWKHLKSIASLHCKFIHCVSFTSRLTQLRIFHTPQEENQLITVFPNMTFLKHLTLDIFCGQPNAYTGLNMDQYLKTLHTTIPELESLCLIFTNSRSEAPNLNFIHRSIHLKALSLKGIPLPFKWFRSILENYRFLESLEIVDPIIGKVNTYLQTDALVQLVQQLTLLKKLLLKGETVCYLYSDALINSIARSDIRHFEYDFVGYDLNKAIRFLNTIKECPLKQLQRLRIRLANQCSSWPGSLQCLYQCENLVDLDLWFARGFMDPHPYTNFILDDFLQQMPRVKRLRLKEADVKLGGYVNSVFVLQVLDLRDSRVVGIEELCLFISKQCAFLTQLSVALGEGDVKLHLPIHRLDKLRLYYVRTLNYFLRIVPSIENQPDLMGFCLVKEKDNHRIVSVDELKFMRWQRSSFFLSARIFIQCKSLRRLYVDDTRVPTHLLSCS